MFATSISKKGTRKHLTLGLAHSTCSLKGCLIERDSYRTFHTGGQGGAPSRILYISPVLGAFHCAVLQGLYIIPLIGSYRFLNFTFNLPWNFQRHKCKYRWASFAHSMLLFMHPFCRSTNIQPKEWILGGWGDSCSWTIIHDHEVDISF